MTVIAVMNNKGGVGKTTTVQWIAPHLFDKEGVNFFVDLDPQANLTEQLTSDSFKWNSGDWLLDKCVDENGGIPIDNWDGMTIASIRLRIDDIPCRLIPASSELESSGLQLATKLLSHTYLNNRLFKQEESTVIIDCPPSLGILTANAITAADLIIIPSTPEESSIIGAQKTIGLINELRNADVTNAKILGVIAFSVNERANEHRVGVRRLAELGVPLLGIVPQRQGVYAEEQTKEFYRLIVDGMREVA